MINIDQVFDDLEDRKVRFETVTANVESMKKTCEILENAEMTMQRSCQILGKTYVHDEFLSTCKRRLTQEIDKMNKLKDEINVFERLIKKECISPSLWRKVKGWWTGYIPYK